MEIEKIDADHLRIIHTTNETVDREHLLAQKATWENTKAEAEIKISKIDRLLVILDA